MGENCNEDYTGYGYANCDVGSLYGVSCSDLENPIYGWDCSGCDCPIDE
jgi:hypothetical protein